MLETHLPLFYRTFVPDKILEHFITLAALVQKHLIIRHRVTNNSNCLAMFLQIISDETGSLRLSRASSRSTYGDDGFGGMQLS